MNQLVASLTEGKCTYEHKNGPMPYENMGKLISLIGADRPIYKILPILLLYYYIILICSVLPHQSMSAVLKSQLNDTLKQIPCGHTYQKNCLFIYESLAHILTWKCWLKLTNFYRLELPGRCDMLTQQSSPFHFLIPSNMTALNPPQNHHY